MHKMATHSRLIRSGFITMLLATAACTQSPAQVVLKGQNFYGPDGVVKASPQVYARNYSYRTSSAAVPVAQVQASNAAPQVSDQTYQTAAVQSIGVSDLPPPAAAKSAPVKQAEAKPEAKPEEKHEMKVADRTQPVNLWTHESHFSSSGDTPGLLTQSVKSAPGVSYMWPVSSHKVLSSYGPKPGGRVNDGLTIASTVGEPVWAAADGEVVFVGDELKGYGNMVLIKHSDGKTTTYAHLNRATIDKYDRVKQGDIIGYVGATGNVRDPQLYFAINDGKRTIDPQKYLSKSVAGL